jgi:hypothetical protein
VAGKPEVPVDIEANLGNFMGGRKEDARYTSFDYCFNYFQSHRERGEVARLASRGQMQASCLQLGFYLASWGMCRSSGLLIGRSAKQFEPVVELIAGTPPDIWDIDAHCYSYGVCSRLVALGEQVRRALGDPARQSRYPTRTLATKVMLGVFGNVPAFDTYVRTGLRQELGVSRFGAGALGEIGRFYQDNATAIDRGREPTLDFDTGAATHRLYSRAKVIDMIFYVEGGGRGSRSS